MDVIDQNIIRLLEDDAHKTSGEIAKHINVSSATIRRRLKKLIDSHTLRLVATVDPEKIGFPLIAGMVLQVDPKDLDRTLDFLASKPEVRWLGATTGNYNIVGLARFASTDAFFSFIKDNVSTLDKVKVIQTFVCINIRKGRWGARL